MSINIFKHEFRTRIKSVLIWSISMGVLIAFFFVLFPAFSEQAAIMNEFLEKYPPELRAAFGMDNMDLASVLGFFSFLFMFVQICLAIQASNYGFGLVSIEESELTADFLLTRPVSRNQVLTSKLLAALASLLVTQAVVWLASIGSVTMYNGGKEYEMSHLLLILLGGLIFQLFFLGVGLVISLIVKRVRSVTPYGLGLGMGMYVLSAFSGVFGDVALEYITPFKHFDAAYIAENGAFNTPLVLLNVGVSLAAVVISYWLYNRRDIHAVS